MIQTQINNFGKVAPPPGFYAKLAKGAIMEINANEMHFFTDARISKQVPIPIRVGTKPFEVSIVQNPGPDERELAKLELMDPIDVWVHNELQIPLNSKIVVKNENQKHVREILKQIASEQGISELKLQAKFKPTITVFGFTLYSGLPLYRNIDIGSVSSKINSLEPAAFPTEVDESGESLMDKMLIFKNPDNGKLKSMYNEEDISTLPSGWSWVWKSLITSMDDESFEVTAAAAFENTTPFETIPIDAFEFYLHIENIRIVKISLTKLGLASGFNGDFDAGYKMTFIDDLIDPVQVQNAIEVALKNLNSGDFSFGLAGPMKLTKADWISSVSPEMSLKFRMSSVRSLVQTRVGAFVKQSNSSMLNMLGLENSKINFMVLADRMKTVANINLKTWANIKPPLDLKFPYTASLNVFAGGSEKVMEIISNPITATRSPIGMMINTDCEVIPVNSDAAATALANAINPSISVNPQV